MNLKKTGMTLYSISYTVAVNLACDHYREITHTHDADWIYNVEQVYTATPPQCSNNSGKLLCERMTIPTQQSYK